MAFANRNSRAQFVSSDPVAKLSARILSAAIALTLPGIVIAGMNPIVVAGDGPRLAKKPGIWISRDEIMKLPMDGPAWIRLLNTARLSRTRPVLSNQNDNADVETLAKSLYAVRTGDRAMADEVRENINASIGTEMGGRTLAVARNIPSIVIAADLVALSPERDAVFRKWLRGLLAKNIGGRSLCSTHEDRPNNWGTHAGAARAAIAAYLGDKAELARTAEVFQGWLGDRNAYAGFKYGDLSWQADSLHPVGINPKGSIRDGHSIDGALPEEMHRGGGFRWPPVRTAYAWEGLQGAFVQAEILHRAGYDVYNWRDKALLRAVQFLYDVNWPASGDDDWLPFLIDARYGTQFAVGLDARHGKNMGWTAWTHPHRTR